MVVFINSCVIYSLFVKYRIRNLVEIFGFFKCLGCFFFFGFCIQVFLVQVFIFFSQQWVRFGFFIYRQCRLCFYKFSFWNKFSQRRFILMIFDIVFCISVDVGVVICVSLFVFMVLIFLSDYSCGSREVSIRGLDVVWGC